MRDIKPLNDNGGIRIRFSLDRVRYSFAPIPGGNYSNKRDLATARSIATRIQNDILAGVFDPTLARYKPAGGIAPAPAQVAVKRSTLQLWDEWVNSLDLPPETKADHYEMIRRMIARAKPALTDTSWLSKARLAPSTFNKRLGYAKRFYKWLILHSRIESSPFDAVKTRKTINPQVKPFTAAEMRSIVAEFDRQYPHYVAFVKFLFMTGARTSEAIGLLWRHVDLDRDELSICESLPKDRTGNGYTRRRKSTKTGQSRVLTISADLKAVMLGIKPEDADRGELVFKSARGCVIDAGNFREDWKAVLESLGIEYRKPYTSRHSLLSHAIDQGMPITAVAYVAGHTDTRMVMQTYGHLIDRPKLPKIDL